MLLDNCLFCKIINFETQANIICENKFALSFYDIKPQAKVHILIVPKIHIESTLSFNRGNIHYLGEMSLLSKKIAEKENIINSGFRWVINTGKDGGQTVNHLHMHLLGGRKLLWPPG